MMHRTSSNLKPSFMRSSKKHQVANSFDIIDDADISTRIKKPTPTDPSIRHSTRTKISQNVGRVTHPVRKGAESAARRGREGVDAVARRGRQGVDAVTRRSRQGVETLRARSKSVPRVRRSSFPANKMMRDKPLPESVFGRKKEKKGKCTEDWRNKMPSSTVEKKGEDELKRRDSSGSSRKVEVDYVSSRSSGRRTSHYEEFDYDDDEKKVDGDFRRTRISGSRTDRRSYEEVEEIDGFARTRSSGSHRSERRYYDDEETEIIRNRSSGSRSERYVVEIDEYY